MMAGRLMAERFPLPIRIGDATFFHHQKLAIQELAEDQRIELLRKSSKNAWSVATLVRERDKLLGKPERVPVQAFDAKVQHVIDQLPARWRSCANLLRLAAGKGGKICTADEGVLAGL